MKLPAAANRRRAASAVLALALLSEITGLAMAARPAAAAPRAADPAITITAGGDRTASDTVSGLAGVGFGVSPPATSTNCPTGAGGTCTASVTSGRTYTITQTGAPSGWFLNPKLGTGTGEDINATSYTSLTTPTVHGDISIPEASSGSPTSVNARGSLWAASRDDPPLPSACGLNVALLFDLSTSVSSPVNHLPEYKSAGEGFVHALAGTPSSVALYTFGTRAPANTTNNANVPLTPLTTTANVDHLISKIHGFSVAGSQFTNWDEGMWQIAAHQLVTVNPVHYNTVIVLTDGDPTVYGAGIGAVTPVRTRFIDVENGIFSANALKKEGTRVIAVGIGASKPGSIDNLKAISGPTANSDYFTTNFEDLEALLRELALAGCSGTVNVTKLVIPGDRQGDIAAAVPAPGWTIHASGTTVTPAMDTTGATGAVSFRTQTSASEDVTISEDVKNGYTHVPVDGKNAVCHDLAGDPVPVTDTASGPGFTVTAVHGDIISCSLYNQEAAPAVITTNLSDADGEVGVGGSASDSAALHGATAGAGGTVQYRFYDSLAACDAAAAAFPPAGGGTLVSTVTVTDGSVPDSAARVFPDAGTFYWAAFYSGDAGNHPAVSDCAAEPLVVTPAEPVITTNLSDADGQVEIGGSASDSATLDGATAGAGGTVQYRFYDSLAACDAAAAAFPPAGGGTLVSTVTVAGGSVPDSAAHTFPDAGTFYWAAFYSGDGNNSAAVSDCAAEPLVVTPAPAEITTALSDADGQITAGGSASDSAALHGATAGAGGTVQYRFYDSLAACDAAAAAFPPAGGGTLVSTVTVAGGLVPDSAAHTFPDAGTFYWAAFYSGDGNNSAAVSDCAAEPLVVTPAMRRTVITTRLSASDGEVGVSGSASDSAALHGATAGAGGTVQYRFYDSLAACDAAAAAFPPAGGGTRVSTVTVTDGSVPDSAARVFPTTGTFYWVAFYSGDAGNHPAVSDCAAEPLVVTAAPPGPASVVVNKDWVIDGVTQRDPNQDPDFQASLSLSPLVPPGVPATWGEERFGYVATDVIDIGEPVLKIPAGCMGTTSGDVGSHTLTAGLNTFTVINTVTCDQPSPNPGLGTHLTLVKQISNPFKHVKVVPLTSWTLTARRAPGQPPVIKGTTGVTGNAQPDVEYLLAESKVPGYTQQIDPAVIRLAPGATGSWECVVDLPRGSGLEDFDGGTGVVVLSPGQHVTCTAVNLLTRAIPVGPPATGGGFAPAAPAAPIQAAGLALIAVAVLLGITGLRLRRTTRPAQVRPPGGPAAPRDLPMSAPPPRWPATPASGHGR